MKFKSGDKALVRRTKQEYTIVVSFDAIDGKKPESYYQLDNLTYYWEHELEGVR